MTSSPLSGPGRLALDHLAICAATLGAGVTWAEDRLGVAVREGGRHALFGTWNRLIRLGDGEYLEVIAPDPSAPAPGRSRWFGLDAPPAQPALSNWICRADDIGAVSGALPADPGRALDLARGDLSWTITVPDDGSLPMEAGCPTLISWGPGGHPAERLPDDGIRLLTLEIAHPEARLLAESLGLRLDDSRIRFREAPDARLSAVLSTPAGEVRL